MREIPLLITIMMINSRKIWFKMNQLIISAIKTLTIEILDVL